MLSTQGYAAMTAKAPLQSFSFERREVGPQDMLITITHCGVCHSDIHQARDEWGGSISPMVPGHEIVGTVTQIGPAVKTFKVGERAGVGCFVDSCRICAACREGSEQYCEAGVLLTYNGRDKDGSPPRSHRLGPPPCCARASRPTLRCATGASASITSLQRWDWVDWAIWL